MSLFKSRTLVLVLPFLLSVSGYVDARECGIAEIRKEYAEATLKVASKTYEDSADRNDPEDIDFEEQGCISDYGFRGSFGLPSLASGFLDGLKDKACAAADEYIESNLSQFQAGFTSPLEAADLDVGIEQLEDDDDGGVDFTEGENEFGPDAGGAIEDAFDKLPDVDSGYGDYQYGEDNSSNDYDYIDRKEGERR